MGQQHLGHEASKASDGQSRNQALRVLARVIARRHLEGKRDPTAENHSDLGDRRKERENPNPVTSGNDSSPGGR